MYQYISFVLEKHPTAAAFPAIQGELIQSDFHLVLVLFVYLEQNTAAQATGRFKQIKQNYTKNYNQPNIKHGIVNFFRGLCHQNHVKNIVPSKF